LYGRYIAAGYRGATTTGGSGFVPSVQEAALGLNETSVEPLVQGRYRCPKRQT
jgi:hypothetical protein